MKQTTLSLLAITLLFSPAFAVEDLGEIIVTSTNRLPQKIKHSTAHVTVITAEDIAERGYQNIPDILSHTSGFSFASNGGAGQTTSLFVRGLTSDNLLILIDGTPLTDYTQPSAAASLEHIALDSIEKIEVVKGGQSGIWGAGAAAGTINIITKGGSKNYAGIRLKTGSHNTHSIGMDISKKFDEGSLYLGGDIMSTDGFSALSPKEAEKDGYSNKSFHIKSSLRTTPDSTLSFFFHSYKGTFDFDANNDANDSSAKGESDQTLFGLGYHYQKEALSLHAKVTHRAIERSLQGAGAWGPWTYETEGKSTHYALTGNYDFHEDQSLSAGIEHTVNKAKTASGFGSDEASFKNAALFASYTHSIAHLLGAKTTFNAVLRYDQFDQFDNKATYRLGIKRVCDTINGLHTAANIYTGYKAPSLFQFSNATGTLKPESIQGYELSVGYKKYLTLTYFSNKIKDKIDSLYDPATFTTQYFNHGNGVKTTGIEFSTEYAFGDSGFILGAHVTHMLDFEDDNGKAAQRIPENSANLTLDYYFNEASHIGIIANYIGKRRDIDYSVWPATDVTLDSYTTIDLTYNTKFNENLSLAITAKNILDKAYETIKGYSTEGRSIYATIKYTF